MTINTEVQLTKSLYMKIGQAIFLRSWKFFGLIIFVFIVSALLFVSTHPVIAFILFIIFICLIFVVHWIAILCMAFSSMNSNFFLLNRITIDEQGVSTTSSMEESKVKWEFFKSWKKMAGCYILFVSQFMFLAIPQSAIPATDITAFESLLRNNIKSNSKKK